MSERFVVTMDEAVAARMTAAVAWADAIAPQGGGRCELLDASLRRVAGGESLVPDAVRAAVRDMLRHGTYKPTGRGKPASEFLLQAAQRGEFPRVHAAVDANNAVSLASGLPGSIFDLALVGERLHLRYGRAGEAYVFNPSGQSIDLEDLTVVCRDASGAWEPCGNPVKDAMITKVRPETRDVIGILYVPRALGDDVARAWGARFAETLASTCGADRVGSCVVSVATAPRDGWRSTD